MNSALSEPVMRNQRAESPKEQAPLLEIRDLYVEVDGVPVLKGVNLTVNRNERVVLLGPNGSGKTSLIKAILGITGYNVKSGKILFNGEDITHASIDERVRKGIAVAFQHPPEVRGVKLFSLLSMIAKKEPEHLIEILKFDKSLLKRDLNVGFSGGEQKKSEILQAASMDPELFILDEPDSGVDVENLGIIGNFLSDFLRRRSALLVTHQGYILSYVQAERAYVMVDGRIACSGPTREVIARVRRRGFTTCGSIS